MTDGLVCLILRAQQIVHEILKGIFLFQEIDFIGSTGLRAQEGDTLNPYHRYPELGTCMEVVKAKPSVFLMRKLNAREEGSELLKIVHGTGLRTRVAFVPPDSQPLTTHCFAPSYALCISNW